MPEIPTRFPAAGSILDGYRLLKEAGKGSCGKVYQAENLVSGRIFALKIFPAEVHLAERELSAIRLYQKIEHPNLIRIHHAGQSGEMLFYTMDWCECSLAQRKVTPEELLQIAKKLTGALAALHERGLIHRDLKPDNIFFRDGEIVLGDIGLITQEENASFAGSPGFLTPALLAHAPNIYSDCYALAKSFYCILSGQRPGKFPYYSGSLSPAASILMRGAMAVCADEPKIRNTAELLDFLKTEELRKPSLRERIFRNPLLPRLFAAILLILAVFAAVCFLRGKLF